jgi:hypothetical protein
VGVRTTMATPRIYSHLQIKLSRFYWGFTVLNVMCVLLAIACLWRAPKESATFPIEAIGFIIFGVASGVMMVLSMISSYQQESKITAIPIVGKVYKALIPKPTRWGEAFHINFMVLVCALMAGFVIVVASKF